MPPPADRDRMYAGLALQMGFIDSDQLLEALKQRGADTGLPLPEWMHQRGWLSREEREELDRVVNRQLSRHPDPALETPTTPLPTPADLAPTPAPAPPPATVDEPAPAPRGAPARAGRGRARWAALAALALAAAVGAAGLYTARRERRLADEARQESGRARAEADANLARAVAAEARLKLAQQAVERSLGVAQSDPALQGEALRGVRRRLLEAARTFYQDAHAPGGPADRERRADHLFALGRIEQEVGSGERALALFEQARDLRRQLAAAHPDRADYRAALASSGYHLAHALRLVARRDDALASLTETIHLVHRLHAEGHRDEHTVAVLAESHSKRALILAEAGRAREALGDWDRAVALADGPRKWRARLRRAEALARADPARGAREAEELARAGGLSAAERYSLARVFALSAAGLAEAGAVPLPVRERLAEAHARRAVALLREAAAEGHFEAAERRAALDAAGELAGLRGREDFRAWREGLPGPGK